MITILVLKALFGRRQRNIGATCAVADQMLHAVQEKNQEEFSRLCEEHFGAPWQDEPVRALTLARHVRIPDVQDLTREYGAPQVHPAGQWARLRAPFAGYDSLMPVELAEKTGLPVVERWLTEHSAKNVQTQIYVPRTFKL